MLRAMHVGGGSRTISTLTIYFVCGHVSVIARVRRSIRGTPNYQGSHQKPSCGGPRGRLPHPSQRRARVSPSRSSYHEPNSPIRIRASERRGARRPSSNGAGATTRRRLPIPSEHPHSYKGVGTDRVRSRTRVAVGFAPSDLRISFEGRLLLNPVELSPPRHAVSCVEHPHGRR